MPSDAPSDEKLLDSFRAGDARAFEVLVRRYERAVLGIARRFCDDRDEAEDIAQRSFINAAQRAGGWRGGSFKSWLFRIVVNLAKNHRRDNARFDRSEAASEKEAAPTESGVEERIEEQQRKLALRAAINKLPKRQQEVLLMRIDADVSFAEIGDVLGITETNAKVNFHHAVAKLKELIAKS